MTLHIGFLVFPRVQQLDLTGPHDVFAMVPGATVDYCMSSSEVQDAARPAKEKGGELLRNEELLAFQDTEIS